MVHLWEIPAYQVRVGPIPHASLFPHHSTFTYSPPIDCSLWNPSYSTFLPFLIHWHTQKLGCIVSLNAKSYIEVNKFNFLELNLFSLLRFLSLCLKIISSLNSLPFLNSIFEKGVPNVKIIWVRDGCGKRNLVQVVSIHPHWHLLRSPKWPPLPCTYCYVLLFANSRHFQARSLMEDIMLFSSSQKTFSCFHCGFSGNLLQLRSFYLNSPWSHFYATTP